MTRKDYRDFLRDGGRTFTLHFAAPFSTYAERAAELERRSYKEVFRRAIEEYIDKHHPNVVSTGKEVPNAK
jgi:hypothetical protein